MRMQIETLLTIIGWHTANKHGFVDRTDFNCPYDAQTLENCYPLTLEKKDIALFTNLHKFNTIF